MTTFDRDQVKAALGRIAEVVIANIGDAPKSDLILIGSLALGSTEEEMKVDFPEFYVSEEVELEPEELDEEEQLNNEEDEKENN